MYIVVYRFSIFGDFKRFEPTSARIIEWTQALQEDGHEYLPTVQEPSVTPMPFPMPFPMQTPSAGKGVQFSSPRNDMFVRINSERIDVEANWGKKDVPAEALKEKFSELIALAGTITRVLGEIKGTRLAYYVDGLLPEERRGAFQPFYKRNDIGIVSNPDVACQEWRHRSNRRLQLKFAEQSELCNAILELTQTSLQFQNDDTHELETVNGLHLTADINTLSEQIVERFAVSDIEPFCLKAQDLFFNTMEHIHERLV